MSGSDALDSVLGLLAFGRGLYLTARAPGTVRASQVLDASLHAYHALVDPGRPSGISPKRFLCVGFWGVKHHRRLHYAAITGLYQALESAVSLAVYVVPCVRFTRVVRLSHLLHRCNTRYEWLVRPYSAGTCTLQEAPSFAWRTNARASAAAESGSEQERRL